MQNPRQSPPPAATDTATTGRTRGNLISAAITGIAWLAFYLVSGSEWVALGLTALAWALTGLTRLVARLRGGDRG